MSPSSPKNIIDNPNNPAPPEILARQVALTVPYIDFNGQRQSGTIEVHEAVAKDVKDFFDQAFTLEFPIDRVLRSSHPNYQWDDIKLMGDNTSSGFNYRLVAGTNRMSLHGQGKAIDVNTRLNPCIRRDESGQTFVNGKPTAEPSESFWDPDQPGTLTADHPLVKFMEERGWEWGGHWTLEKDGIIDYQHFQKGKNPVQNR